MLCHPVMMCLCVVTAHTANNPTVSGAAMSTSDKHRKPSGEPTSEARTYKRRAEHLKGFAFAGVPMVILLFCLLIYSTTTIVVRLATPPTPINGVSLGRIGLWE